MIEYRKFTESLHSLYAAPLGSEDRKHWRKIASNWLWLIRWDVKKEYLTHKAESEANNG